MRLSLPLAVLASGVILAAQSPPGSAEGTISDPADCLKCHRPIDALLHKSVKHGAVEDGCLSCHLNHLELKSRELAASHYLRAQPPGVCLFCHSTDDPGTAAAHRGQPVAKSRCTGCHDPHGSDRARLILPVQHEPYAERQCDVCHKPPVDGKVKLVAASVNELCQRCHTPAKLAMDGAHASQASPGADTNGCLGCHDPHASSNGNLLKKPLPAAGGAHP